MTQRRAGGRLVLGLLGGWAAVSLAQEPPRLPNDPTQPNPDLREKLDALKPRPEVVRPIGGPGLVLRGRLLVTGQPAAALLEIEGRVQLVRTGTLINLGSRQSVRILSITAAEVRLEVEPTKDVVTLH
jgi:hypothetical protein